MDAFSRQSGSVDNEPSTAMLSEIGILPPGSSMIDFQKKTRLATDIGCDRFCSSLVSVSDHLLKKSRLNFEKKIVVYIDPTPTSVGSSLHAMCFTTRAENIDPNHGEARYWYVLLAVEEFSTEDITSDNDGMDALARVFINTVVIIHRLYDGFFDDYVVAPEANSFHVERFWRRCSQLFQGFPELENAVDICATTIAVRGPAKRHSPYPKNKKIQTYRVGYALGSEKVFKIYNFFASMFNPSSDKKNAVVCAKEIWSWSVRHQSDSIPYYVSQKLNQLEVRPKVNHASGITTYKIGGKQTNTEGEYVQDDLAIATVMSVCLYEDMTSGKYRGDLVRLDKTFPCQYQLFDEDEEI